MVWFNMDENTCLDLDELLKALTSPKVIERGCEMNKQFNNFSVEDLYMPFTI